MQKSQLRKGTLVEKLHVNGNLIIMKPPQRVRPHLARPILPVPQPERAGRTKRACAGGHGNLGGMWRPGKAAHPRCASRGSAHPVQRWPFLSPLLPCQHLHSTAHLLSSCLKPVPASPLPPPRCRRGGHGRDLAGRFTIWNGTVERDAVISFAEKKQPQP